MAKKKAVKRKEPETRYDQRASNIQGHGYATLKTRESLMSRTPSGAGKKMIKDRLRWDTTLYPDSKKKPGIKKNRSR